MRQLDSKLPASCQSYDESDFLENPTKLAGVKAGRFQLMKFRLKFKHYLEALVQYTTLSNLMDLTKQKLTSCVM